MAAPGLGSSAAAGRDAAGEVRVPCPQCGGLVHPVAGRCKHCKADLAATRVRGTAPTALPSLGGPSSPAGAPQGARAAYARAADPAPTSLEHDTDVNGVIPRTPPNAAVLPPAPRTHRVDRGWAQQWPIVVIALAVIAIIAAIAIMLWPAGSPEATTAPRGGAAPPAPDRMDTNPQPSAPTTPAPSPGLTPPADDPWSGPGGAAPRPDPAPGGGQIAPADPDLSPLALAGGGFAAAAVSRLCTRLTSCQQLDASVCALFDAGAAAAGAPPPSCPAAAQCLDAIDHLDCNPRQLDTGAMISLFLGLKSCADALRC
jgi:hypothetical protein